MHTRIPTSKYACTHAHTANSDVYSTILQKIVRENTRIYENIREYMRTCVLHYAQF